MLGLCFTVQVLDFRSYSQGLAISVNINFVTLVANLQYHNYSVCVNIALTMY